MARTKEPIRGRGQLSPGVGPTTPGIPGFDEVEIQQLDVAGPADEVVAVLASTSARLIQFLEARDAVALLAKSGEQLLREQTRGQIGSGPSGLEQAHVELLQAFTLVAGAGRRVPASPNSMVRLWKLVQRNLEAYVISTRPVPDVDQEAILARSVRLRTIYYRNVFDSDAAAEVVPALLTHLDTVSESEFGYRMSDLARALFTIFNMVLDRLNERLARREVLLSGAAVDVAIGEMLEESELARRLWRMTKSCPMSQLQRGLAGFQMAEMLCAPLFTFRREELAAQFGEPVTTAIFSCALTFGSLSEDELSRAYLTNPVWERPFITLDADTLFIPTPALIISFPFAIVERLIHGHPGLQEAYSKARTQFLENDVLRIVKESLPSATVYSGVRWTDPDTKVQYEHDVVAVVGMQVLIFEAKSGKLAAAARRGGLKSLKNNFRDLFIEPGRQASRLEALVASRRSDVRIVDRNGIAVRFDTSGPSVVYKFGVCMEQFAGVTSSRRLFREMGLLDRDQDWAPVVTLSELRMISDRLDTEISFLHYLTRRTTADDVFDFVADEQDLLSMYLTNGFSVDVSSLEGRTVMFFKADGAVRGRASPRADRRDFATPGIALPPAWRLIGKDIYGSDIRHRFDILLSILNQSPNSLDGAAQRLRRWRSGGVPSTGNTMFSQARVADRVFIVAIHLVKEQPPDEDAWVQRARAIGYDLATKLGATDCVIGLKVRKSKTLTFEAISFLRFPAEKLRLAAEQGDPTPKMPRTESRGG